MLNPILLRKFLSWPKKKFSVAFVAILAHSEDKVAHLFECFFKIITLEKRSCKNRTTYLFFSQPLLSIVR